MQLFIIVMKTLIHFQEEERPPFMLTLSLTNVTDLAETPTDTLGNQDRRC